MNVGKEFRPFICPRCLLGQSKNFHRTFSNGRYLSQAPTPQNEQLASEDTGVSESPIQESQRAHGAGRMSERLAQMTEESIDGGGRSAKKVIKEGGFPEELKRQLEARIKDSTFRSDNPAAFAQANMPASAGEGTRNVAAGQPWTGTETVEDAALRMLNDAHKPFRGTGHTKILTPRGPPASVDMRMKKAVQRSQGERLSNARDRMSFYALSHDPSLSEKGREQMRKTFKERFTAGARPMPGSVQGLAALANERIEDAIARGQFKNIARGKGKNIERDHAASSPFLDTTEYFMNKIIQKQEIVPPWIEKQQELVKAANVFRNRLRADWKRHAARVIASKGGSLASQVKRAEAYAAAEAAETPWTKNWEALSEGKPTQVAVTKTPTPATEAQDNKITVSEDLAATSQAATQPPPTSQTPPPTTPTPHPPFRDPAWLSLENAYHTLAITSLNNLTRSYNLQAPDLAKKPYFSLDRELRSCFADIAPLLPREIRERAKRPERVRVEVVGHNPGGMLERFGGEKVRVWDEKRPSYGFRQFWMDLWRKG